MQPTQTYGFDQIAMELITGVLETVANPPNISTGRQASLEQTVACVVMAFNPRDPIETMMAGQCVVYDHLLRDGARDVLRGQVELLKIRSRPGILSAGKMFLATVEALSRMQGRAADQLAFAREPEAPAEPARPVQAASPADPPPSQPPSAQPPPAQKAPRSAPLAATPKSDGAAQIMTFDEAQLARDAMARDGHAGTGLQSG